MRLLSAQARAIIPAYLLPTLPNEAYALAQVMKEYSLVAQANARQAILAHDHPTAATQARYVAIFNAEYHRLMSIAQPPLKEAGPSVAWVPGSVTAAMPAAVVVPGRTTADLKPGAVTRVSLPGASKTEPSSTTASGKDVVTTVSTPTDDAVAQAAVDEQVAAASTSWLSTTTGQLVVGAGLVALLLWGISATGDAGFSQARDEALRIRGYNNPRRR